jgi:ubiquitin carboxyl-terminal hydrolase 9/24
MTITTKPSPVGDDVAKQVPPPPPPVNHLDGQPPPLQLPTFTPGCADNVSSLSAAEQVEQPSDPAVHDSAHDFADGNIETTGGVNNATEPEFPLAELMRLDEMINRPRWVVPVLHNCELEILLDASIALCKKGLDVKCEACQRFFKEGLTTSFIKILTDEAVSGWKTEIQKCIMSNSLKLIELCVLKLDQDWFPLLDLLTMVLNPMSRFHMFNASRQPEFVNVAQITDDELFARPVDVRMPRGWLVDLVNKFGLLGGFQILLSRFQKNLSVSLIAALVRPFGLCYEVLTINTVQKFFLPIIEIVSQFMENLNDDELKKESKTESKKRHVVGYYQCTQVPCIARSQTGREDKKS